jgi:5-methylcytosine-specific restriction endonuclease McrA
VYKRCEIYGCGCTSNLEIHHIIPRSQGGPTERWNLITLCVHHHNLITNGKLKDIHVLNKLKNKKHFRWQRSLDWHLNKEKIRKLRNV